MKTITFELEDDIYNILEAAANHVEISTDEMARISIVAGSKGAIMAITNPELAHQLMDSEAGRIIMDSTERSIERAKEESIAANVTRRGWGRPFTRSATKYHYFRDGHSLCGKYEDPGGLHLRIWGTWELVKDLEAMGKQMTEEACKNCRRIA